MATTIAPLPIRCLCDLAAINQMTDLNRGTNASFQRGDDVQVDIALGQNGNILPPDLTDVTSVTCQLFAAQNDTNPPMMSCTVLAAAMLLTLTSTAWANGVNAPGNCHASFVFPNSQTAITLNGQASQTYWLRITAQTGDATAKTITFLDGPIVVKDGPVSTASAAPASPFRLYAVAGVIQPQLLDTSTGLYHTLFLENDAGVLTLGISDTGY